MDSVSQLVLGAAVGAAVLGPQAGRRALVWGAVFGTLPDLDVLYRTGDAVTDVTGHRAWSHSLFVLSAAAAPLGLAIARLHGVAAGPSRRRWCWMVWLVFVTHVLLDCCTVYGTQIFWPLLRRPESWGTVFVIDPLYTLPLVVACVVTWVRSRRDGVARVRFFRPLIVGLLASTLYLGWGAVAQAVVKGRAAQALARIGIVGDRLLVVPTELNSLVWRVVVIDGDERYWEGEHAILAPSDGIELTAHPRRLELLGELRGGPVVKRLEWFTHGFFAVERVGDTVAVVDLRMGAEPVYFFRFAIAEAVDRGLMPLRPTTQLGVAVPDIGSRLVDLARRAVGLARDPRTAGQ